MITYTGVKNGRPSFSQSNDEENRNRGCMPKWLIKALDQDRLKLVNGELKAGSRTIQPSEVVKEQ